MAKRVRTKKVSTADQDLNRWCIEMAMRWPVITTSYGYGNQVGAYQNNMPRMDVEADVIARANKIRAWIKAAA